MESKRFRADRIDLAISKIIPSCGEIANLSVDSFEDEILEKMVVQIRASVYSIPRRKISIKRQFPAGWWEAVKERFAPRWYKSRWPVLYDHIDIDETVEYGPTCPHIHVPDQQKHFEWLQMWNPSVDDSQYSIDDWAHRELCSIGMELREPTDFGVGSHIRLANRLDIVISHLLRGRV